MTADLRTPLQKVVDDMTRIIDIVYEYSIKPGRLFDSGLTPSYFEWRMFYKPIPDKYAIIRGERAKGTKDFAKELVKRVEIMPCLFHAYIYRAFHIGGVKGQVYKFIHDNASRISDCRERYMKWRMAGRVPFDVIEHIQKRRLLDVEVINEIFRSRKPNSEYFTLTPAHIREITERELLDIAKVKRTKALEMWQFIQEVSLKLIHYPLVMTWDEMYEYYLRNTNNSVAALDDARYYLDNRRGDKYAFDLAAMRSDYNDKSPWKSISKIKSADRQKYKEKRRPDTDSFNWKQQRKLMKHYTAPRFTFVIDYFFAGRYRYLLAINVNTRKAFYAIPDEIHKLDHNWNIRGKRGEWNVSSRSAINSLTHIMNNTEVRALIMDNEGAFISDAFKQFLRSNNITFSYVPKYNVGKIIETQEASRSTHTTSLVDRLCRTLRQMNNNLGNVNEIKPPMMNYLIDEYNNSVHTTLSKILKRKVTPNDVDGDVRLETELVKRICVKNFIVENSEDYIIKDDAKLRVYNDSNHMDKVKPKLLPGTWEFVERDGGLYKVKQGRVTIKVPRYMLRTSQPTSARRMLKS